MPVFGRRPKLTHMPHQIAAREERDRQHLLTLSQHEERFCGSCGLVDASRGFKLPGWAHIRDEAIWSCCDAECVAWAKAKVIEQSVKRSAA